MTLPSIPNAEDIFSNPKLYNELNPAEKLTVVCTIKSQTETVLAAGKAEIAARQTALDVSAAATLNPLKEKVRLMKSLAMELVNDHRRQILGDLKTLEVAGQAIGYRFTKSVSCEDEEAAVRGLDLMAADPEASDADRMSAEACLKRELPKLNKNFILTAARKSSAWLAAFGLRVTRSEKLNVKSINTEDE